ncbi:MAG: hypothetical protein PVF22_04190 [Candidatus Aminicenantes bacterium]|jgi:hypothetical protein
MKKIPPIVICLTLFFFFAYQKSPPHKDLKIWKSFVECVKQGEFPAEKIRPLHESLVEPIQGFLKVMRENANWAEWERAPEVVKGSGTISYIIPLTYKNTVDYSFTFLVEENNWYLQHFETIFVRLDKVTSFPTSDFPDMPEDRKISFREEQYWSDAVRLFNYIAQDKGKKEALNFFKDGGGYFVAARAQVPYVPPHRAFILFLCWDLANFRGNDVTLETLEDSEALVRLRLISFYLYEAAAHLKQWISYEDYRSIFETMWLDRAEKAGWNLKIQYEGDEVLFHFSR